MEKILIVEDDQTIAMGLSYFLGVEGYNTKTVETVKGTLEQLKKDTTYEVILLDCSLPDGNGFDLFKEIRKITTVPIIFLTALDDEVSVVMGLDMGADDYITKPFKARELLSRIRNVLRRNKSNNDSSIITIDNIVIDTKQARVFKDGVDVMLTALEYKIMLILAYNPNQVFTREAILADIWDVNEEYVNDNTLTVYIKRLREKIETDKSHPIIIETVRGLGYRVVNNVKK
ncbi:MAG: response regulator transcription factor [Bacilli bacterium]